MNLGLSLFLVYLVGKLITLPFHELSVGPAALCALFWQDALVALCLMAAAKASKAAARIFYVLALTHFAIGVPLLRLMATPLTLPLLRASGGTLADSIQHHIDPTNLILIGIVFFTGTLLPFLLKERIAFHSRTIVASVSAMAIAGFLLSNSADLHGFHRNNLIAFVQSFDSFNISESPPRAPVPNPEIVASARYASARGANILLIGLESTGTRRLKLFGASTDPMPFLSTLATKGLTFENVYAPYPESIKGLFALLFSRTPEFGLDLESGNLVTNTDSLPAVLSRSGYHSALFHSGRFMYLGMDIVIAAAGFHHAFDAGAIGGNVHSSFGVDDFSTVDFLLHWLDRRNSNQPFFVHYLPTAGHHPYETPGQGPFIGGSDEIRYLNALHYSDLALRRVFDGLRNRGLDRNTLVVIYGDHGEAFAEHPGNYGHTLHLFEENVHVPLIFWMPDKLRTARVDRITSLIDIAPSICDLVGVSFPTSFQGATVFGESPSAALFLTDYSLHLSGIRSGRWKLILERESKIARLFDLQSDPGERFNLAKMHPEKVECLRARILEWRGCQERPKLTATMQPVARE